MKYLHVISLSGEKLFTGTKHDCKQFIRKNRINKYTLKSNFIEKVVVAAPTYKQEEEEESKFFAEVFAEND